MEHGGDVAIGGDANTGSPGGGDLHNRSPVHGDLHNRSPVLGDLHNRSPVHGDLHNRSPVHGDLHNRSPVHGDLHNRSPVHGDLHNRSPVHGDLHNRSPVLGDVHNRSPTGMKEQNDPLLAINIENSHSVNKKHTASSLYHADYQSLPKRDTENTVSVSVSVSDVLKTLSLILVWYTISTFLTLYNKTLLGDDLGKFPAPLLMNTIHFVMQAALSNAITCFWPERFHSTVMSWKDYFARVVPLAFSTAMDVNLSNASLVFISVTFATMCKSASPIFLLIFAFAFRLESPSVRLFGIMFVISVGILLTVAKETEFEFWGFVFVMLAAVMSGFRWTMTQILLQKESYGLKNPLVLMSYVTPIMAIATGLLSLALDPWLEFKKSDYFDSSWSIARSCFLMLFGGTMAFFMVLTEYVLISVTSAVTVTVAGVVKEAVTILVAVFYFHDEFTWLKGYGLITIMFGVSLFNWYKYGKLHKSKRHAVDYPSSKYTILEDMDVEESTQSPRSDQ